MIDRFGTAEGTSIRTLHSATAWGAGAALLSYGTKAVLRDVTGRDLWTSLLAGVVVALLVSIPWKKKSPQDNPG